MVEMKVLLALVARQYSFTADTDTEWVQAIGRVPKVRERAWAAGAGGKGWRCYRRASLCTPKSLTPTVCACRRAAHRRMACPWCSSPSPQPDDQQVHTRNACTDRGCLLAAVCWNPIAAALLLTEGGRQHRTQIRHWQTVRLDCAGQKARSFDLGVRLAIVCSAVCHGIVTHCRLGTCLSCIIVRRTELSLLWAVAAGGVARC
jgi:hypothetical protein